VVGREHHPLAAFEDPHLFPQRPGGALGVRRGRGGEDHLARRRDVDHHGTQRPDAAADTQVHGQAAGDRPDVGAAGGSGEPGGARTCHE